MNSKVDICFLSVILQLIGYYLQAEGSSAESIAALAKVDTVKQRMEAAYETLQASIIDFLSSWSVTYSTFKIMLGFLISILFCLYLEKQDAAGLTQLSATVEDVFASGDLPRAAETLANMRHCLSAVGEVTIF